MESREELQAILRERLDVLSGAGIIESEAEEEILSFAKKFMEDLTDPSREAFETLTTHMAMALSRISNEDNDISMPDEVFEDIRTSDLYSRADKNLKNWLPAYYDRLNTEELKYILLHMLSIYEADRS